MEIRFKSSRYRTCLTRLDVVVHSEEVGWAVFILQCNQAIVTGAVGCLRKRVSLIRNVIDVRTGDEKWTRPHRGHGLSTDYMVETVTTNKVSQLSSRTWHTESMRKTRSAWLKSVPYGRGLMSGRVAIIRGGAALPRGRFESQPRSAGRSTVTAMDQSERLDAAIFQLGPPGRGGRVTPPPPLKCCK